jgi:hypothetical protein
MKIRPSRSIRKDGIDRHNELDVRGSVHHSKIHKQKIQQDATMYQNFYHSIFI